MAFSGGVDSSFLLKVAKDVLGDKVIAVTAVTPLQPDYERLRAEKIARSLGVKHVTIDPKPLNRKAVKDNTKNRCYHCKLALMQQLKRIAKSCGYVAVEATSKSDLGYHRPGVKAVRCLGISSPLVDAGFNKKEIRQAARRLKLATWNAPSAACLASRIPYGTTITKERLRRIEKAEDYLRRLRFKQIRVRDHHPVARIEIDSREFEKLLRERTKVVRYFKNLGYNFVTLDLTGYKTGSFDL